MKVAFVIHLLSFYRVLAPVIDRALEAGWEVECWHDYGFPITQQKKHLFPATTAAPRFQHGQPCVRSYAGPTELVEWLALGDADAVVSVSTLDLSTGGATLRVHPPWICVQLGPDTFNLRPESLRSCDQLALFSPWWLDWAIDRYSALSQVSDVEMFRAGLESRSRYVGFPASEAAHLVDREAVRRRWGISAHQPVVVLLPFPQGVGRQSFWPKRIFSEASRVRRLFNVVAHRQFGHASDAWGHANEIDVVRSVREFCDRNGAFLIVKSREKTPIPAHVRALADRCLYDESYYPSTIIEALSIADLCVHFYSLGGLEAAALGVPSLCIASRADDYFGPNASRSDLVWFDSFFHRRTGGLFEFNSVSRTVDAGEAIATLSTANLHDFRITVEDGQQYWQKFLGPRQGHATERLLEAIESQVAGKHSSGATIA